jgi:hypothetical protein
MLESKEDRKLMRFCTLWGLYIGFLFAIIGAYPLGWWVLMWLPWVVAAVASLVFGGVVLWRWSEAWIKGGK